MKATMTWNRVRPAASVLVVMLTNGCGNPLASAPKSPGAQSCVEQALRRSADPSSLPLAFAEFRKACAAGASSACSPLGVMFELGLATGSDPARAVQLYRAACLTKNVGGCVNLALAYRRGVGVAADPTRALTLLSWGCRHAHALACRELGTMQLIGEGGDADAAGAAQSYRSACDGGDGQSCHDLGALYASEDWLAGDAAAADLHHRACFYGFTADCDGIERVEPQSAASSLQSLREAAPTQ